MTLSDYWDSLDKPNRLRVWDSLEKETKFKIPFSNSLTISQSRRLWDNIGHKNRLALWLELSDVRKKDFLANMTTH